MNLYNRIKLSFMMFLEFFIWGSWFVTLGTYLGRNLLASGSESAAVFSTQSFGAIIAPFIIGLIADRYFNAERILGILHLIGAILMSQMYYSVDFAGFYPYVFAYMIIFMPTLALVNSVAFNQMKNAEREFSSIRIWGTIGWIVVGLCISFLFHWDSSNGVSEGLLRNTFAMAGISSLILGIFSFSLPKTPPTIFKGEKYKSAAQGLITLATYGVGMLIGFWVAGIVSDAYKVSDNQHDWKKIWMISSGIAAVVAILFFIFFSQSKEDSERKMDQALKSI